MELKTPKNKDSVANKVGGGGTELPWGGAPACKDSRVQIMRSIKGRKNTTSVLNVGPARK